MSTLQPTVAMKPLLVDCEAPLTASRMQSLYGVEYSDVGSNRREAGEDTKFCFESFLRFLECKSYLVPGHVIIS